MGPGRLTGMNAEYPDHGPDLEASMGPGRLTGMNVLKWVRAHDVDLQGFNGARSIDRDERWLQAKARRSASSAASMGPGRLTGMNALSVQWTGRNVWLLQWGPVD